MYLLKLFLSPVALNALFTFYKGGEGGGSTTSTTQNYSPEEAAQRAKVQSEAARLYNETAGKISSSPYTGAQVVPFTGDTQTAQGLTRVAANTMAGSTIPQLNQATQFGLSDVMDVNSNPYLQSSIAAAVRPITQSYTDPNGVLSNIRSESMVNGGQGTSTRQGIAEGIAAGRYADAIGGTASQMASAGYDKGLDTFSRIYGLAPQAMDTFSKPAQLYSAVGAQNQGMAQAQEDYAANARNWDLNSEWAPLQNWANIVYGGTGPMGSTTNSSGPGNQSNPMMGAMGGAMAGAQVAGPWGAVGGAILGGLFS